MHDILGPKKSCPKLKTSTASKQDKHDTLPKFSTTSFAKCDELFWSCQSGPIMMNNNDKTLYIVLPSVPQDHLYPDHPLIVGKIILQIQLCP